MSAAPKLFMTAEQSHAHNGSEDATTTFHVLPNVFALCRFPPDANVPTWVFDSSFYTISKSDTELSIVCEERLLDQHKHRINTALGDVAQIERSWNILRLGVMDLSLVGIAARFAHTLASAGVSLNIIATFDTDYVMVRSAQLYTAITALRANGYNVQESVEF